LNERVKILTRIAAIVGETLGVPVPSMNEATRASDVRGWDSLAHVNIILNIEKAFGIRFKAADIARIENAGSLVDIIAARGKA
jgi:acyl carrier protein